MTHFDTDQKQWALNPREVESIAHNYQLSFFEASSATGFNVKNVFHAAIDGVISIFAENPV